MKEYYFYIQIGPTWTQFVPLKNWSFTRANETIRPVTNISDLSFVNDEFDTLYTQSKTKSVLNIRLYENTTLVWSGEITLSGSYDFDNRICTLKLSENTTNIYKIIENLNPEINLLDIQTERNSIIQETTLRHIVINYNNLLDSEKPGAIEIAHNDYNWNSLITYENSLTYKYAKFFLTEKHVVYKNDKAYISLQDNNLNKDPETEPLFWSCLNLDLNTDFINLYYETQLSLVFNGNNILHSYYRIGMYGSETAVSFTTNLDHGRLLYDVFNLIITTLGNGILISKTVGLNCWCNIFESSETYKYLRLYQLTDIIRFDAQYPATKCIYKFSDFMAVIKQVYGLDWFINSNGYFQLVEYDNSIFESISLDTTPIQSTRDKYQTTKKDSKLISVEKYTFLNSQTSFDTVTVDYRQNGEPLNIENSNVYNNVSNAILNEELNTSSIAFIVVDASDNILKTGDVYNYPMSAEQLFRNFLTTNRPAKIGYINNEAITLYDTDSLEIKEITIKADQIDLFGIDMNGLCKTGFETVLEKDGFRIKKIQKTFDNKLTLNLSL